MANRQSGVNLSLLTALIFLWHCRRLNDADLYVARQNWLLSNVALFVTFVPAMAAREKDQRVSDIQHVAPYINGAASPNKWSYTG